MNSFSKERGAKSPTTLLLIYFWHTFHTKFVICFFSSCYMGFRRTKVGIIKPWSIHYSVRSPSTLTSTRKVLSRTIKANSHESRWSCFLKPRPPIIIIIGSLVPFLKSKAYLINSMCRVANLGDALKIAKS